VLLTTHYIEEAERLCDRVAIMDRGRMVALGTPRELIQRAGHGTRLEVRLSKPVQSARLIELDAILDCRETDGTYFLHAHPAAQAVVSLIRFLETEGNTLLDMHIGQPSLEDVFVELTGRRLSE
jgi:ABC-2 type transport system ATP-binding protein